MPLPIKSQRGTNSFFNFTWLIRRVCTKPHQRFPFEISRASSRHVQKKNVIRMSNSVAMDACNDPKDRIYDNQIVITLERTSCRTTLF